MKKLGFVLLLLSAVTFDEKVAAVPDPCYPCPWQSLQGYITTYLDDCAYLHSINRQNLESQASAGCADGLCGESNYWAQSCTKDASGMTTATGTLNYRCNCTLQ